MLLLRWPKKQNIYDTHKNGITGPHQAKRQETSEQTLQRKHFKTTSKDSIIEKTLSAVKVKYRKRALLQLDKTNKRILPFVTQCHPAVTNLKEILMKKCHLIPQQSLLHEIFKEPPIISYRKGRSLKDILVSAKI